MKIRKVVAGSVLAAGLGVAGMIGAGSALADGTAVGSNPSLSDTQGFGVTNHMQGDTVHDTDGYNTENTTGGQVQHNGIGWIRSGQTGEQVSNNAGTNRVVAANGDTLAYQQADVMASGNKVAPGQVSKLAK